MLGRQKLLELLDDRQSLTMVIGAGNIKSNDNDDHVRFNEYDFVMTIDEKSVNNETNKPIGLAVDFNGPSMKGYGKLLKGRFKKIIFDYSTSKFYRGSFTAQFIDMLEPGGQLVIDSKIYQCMISQKDSDIEEFCTFHGIDTEKKTYTGTYFLPYTYIKLKAGVPSKKPDDDDILQNNIQHFKKCNVDVKVVTGNYPIEQYVSDKFQEYNKQMENITYLIVTKPQLNNNISTV